MEFLKELAIPQSLEHVRLLVLISTISSVVYVPYVSFVLGSSILSLWFNRKRHTQENAIFLNFAHELIDTVLFNKSGVTFLALLPAFSLVLSYAQILQGTTSAGVSLEGFSFLFLLAGLILLYSYKYTFRIQEIVGTYQQLLKKQIPHDEQKTTFHREMETRSTIRTGRYGTFFTLIAFILHAAAISVTSNPALWENDSIFSLFISLDVWLKIIELLLLGTGITGIGILFFTFAWESKKEQSEEYSVFVRKLGIRLCMIGLLTLPLVVLFNIAAVPDAALSGTIYSLTGFVIIIFFLAAHCIYGYYKSLQSVSITAGFALFLFATVILITSDNVALSTAIGRNSLLQASTHEKSMEELKSKLGVASVAQSGEDIYNARCFACHLFDRKKVGPPYFETIPKYKGRKAELVSFILNPVKVNPGYPPMPNQGLRSAEADSVASYIIRKVMATVSQAKNNIE
jgi:cytochrome c